MVQRPIYSHLHQSCGSSKGLFTRMMQFIIFVLYRSEQVRLWMSFYYTEPLLYTFLEELGIGLSIKSSQ